MSKDDFGAPLVRHWSRSPRQCSEVRLSVRGSRLVLTAELRDRHANILESATVTFDKRSAWGLVQMLGQGLMHVEKKR